MCLFLFLSSRYLMLITILILTSSADIFKNDSSPSGKSFAQIINRNGPKTMPCRTPQLDFTRLKRHLYHMFCIPFRLGNFLSLPNTFLLCLPENLPFVPTFSGEQRQMPPRNPKNTWPTYQSFLSRLLLTLIKVHMIRNILCPLSSQKPVASPLGSRLLRKFSQTCVYVPSALTQGRSSRILEICERERPWAEELVSLPPLSLLPP